MKYLLLIVATVFPVAGFGQTFNGSILDLDSGKLQAINGSFSLPEQSSFHEKRMARMRNDYERTRAETDRILSEINATRAQAELEEQTRLLRQIANQ